MQLPKILYTSFDQVPAPKGASTHILEFVQALGARYPESEKNADSHQPVGNVVLITPSQHDHPIRQLAPGVRQLRLGCADDNPLGRARIFRAKLQTVLQAQPFNVIHFRSIFEGLVAIEPALSRGAKLIYEVNGFPSIEMKYHYPGLLNEPELVAKLQQQETSCLNSADQIITVSKTTRDLIKTRLESPKPVTVIPNGFSPEEFPGRYPQITGHGPVRIVYFGTASPWQGVETLLEAIELVNKERLCLLTIVGPSSRRQLANLKQTIKRLKIEVLVNIQVSYEQRQICSLLHQSHMTVVPLLNTERNTVQGCCPIKLIEAMASGCPVIASNLPVIRELATPDEHFLPAKPGDARNLKNLILQLAGDPELGLRLSRAARQHCGQKLTWEHATNRLIELYENMLTN